MRRSYAALALGLLTAAAGRANDNGLPAVPPPPPVAAQLPAAAVPPPPLEVAPPLAVQPGAPCGSSCAPVACRPGCMARLWDWLCYRSLPVPPCCKTCCNRVPYCTPPLYAFFLYGPMRCQGGGGVGYVRPACASCASGGCAHGKCGVPPVQGGVAPVACTENCGGSAACGGGACRTGKRGWKLLGGWRPGQYLLGRN